MKHRFGMLFAAVLFASPLAAQDVSEQIVDQLREQGYESVEVTKTWLGRLRIEASSSEQRREIIVNPRTGEILRDFLSSPDANTPKDVQILDRPARRPAPDGQEPARNRAGGEDREGRAAGPSPDGPGRDGGGQGSGPSGPSR